MHHGWPERISTSGGSVKRYGQVIRLQPGVKDEYVRYHADVWPEVLHMIHECNIRNYSIFLRDDTLYAYFEYVGDDFDADMAKMAADAKTQEWWAIMGPMQQPLENRKKGEWWANMEEVFHTD
jgi:L-rhamnose mutarotase